MRKASLKSVMAVVGRWLIVVAVAIDCDDVEVPREGKPRLLCPGIFVSRASILVLSFVGICDGRADNTKENGCVIIGSVVGSADRRFVWFDVVANATSIDRRSALRILLIHASCTTG
jgi:hypothetical protein